MSLPRRPVQGRRPQYASDCVHVAFVTNQQFSYLQTGKYSKHSQQFHRKNDIYISSVFNNLRLKIVAEWLWIFRAYSKFQSQLMRAKSSSNYLESIINGCPVKQRTFIRICPIRCDFAWKMNRHEILMVPKINILSAWIIILNPKCSPRISKKGKELRRTYPNRVILSALADFRIERLLEDPSLRDENTWSIVFSERINLVRKGL